MGLFRRSSVASSASDTSSVTQSDISSTATSLSK